MPDPRAVSASGDPSKRRLYGRRSARKLRPGRARLLAEGLDRVAVPDGPGQPLTAEGLFGPDIRRLWLEIGFGGGEHLAWQAAANPEVGFIGCEPFLNGVASLLRHVAEEGLANVRIHAGDARSVIDRLTDAAVERVFILFPDPWPKRRHKARRIVSAETLDALARVMADGAELRLASDDPVQIGWMLQVAPPHPAFVWQVEGPADWQMRPADWPQTRYEAKALAAGRTPVFLRLRRRSRAVIKT
ncbi:MAG: tRNA (guanine(46)-N(7))-methyltransferase TrmB [Alphaproteobacteria bacterium]